MLDPRRQESDSLRIAAADEMAEPARYEHLFQVLGLQSAAAQKEVDARPNRPRGQLQFAEVASGKQNRPPVSRLVRGR